MGASLYTALGRVDPQARILSPIELIVVEDETPKGETPKDETPKDQTAVQDTSFFHIQASSIKTNIQHGTVKPTTPDYTFVVGIILSGLSWISSMKASLYTAP
ncbi:hypothetical protein H9Q69_005699 [Fusarium xylarioides]|nr:hypothetical protein H9Q69_005699 [Fusarium xylarioides]